ncbi:endonuclease/exonuclease/phosphatase family protein [Streptomyces sp. NPDC052042]|uniref:endonuclease/exonuclease/phosphatase family protein n=1 Tax=Streptomyces sp. NPDC052042 TaxID=3365683 RepID=UPI0037CDC607
MSTSLSPEQGVLRIGTYNMLDGGLDGWGKNTNNTRGLSTEHWKRQMEVLGELRLDVLALQEAKHYDSDDFALAKATGSALGMNWKLAPSARHGCHLMTLVRPAQVEIRDFVMDAAAGAFHHTVSRARLVMVRTGEELDFFNTHLAPFSPQKRCEEVTWLTEHGGRGDAVLVGDLNGPGVADPEPTDEEWKTFPSELHSRHRYLNPDGSYGMSDRRPLATLRHAGFRDVVADLGYPWAPTVGHWSAREPLRMRFDHILPAKGMASRLGDVEVVDTPVTRGLSDHLPVVAEFTLLR